MPWVSLGMHWLRGMEGDRRNVLLCGGGHNLRRTLRRLRFFGCWILGLGGRICGSLQQIFRVDELEAGV